jgi:hypothetical protein
MLYVPKVCIDEISSKRDGPLVMNTPSETDEEYSEKDDLRHEKEALEIVKECYNATYESDVEPRSFLQKASGPSNSSSLESEPKSLHSDPNTSHAWLLTKEGLVRNGRHKICL